MSDRSSAYLFSRIFELIDDHVQMEPDRTNLAREFWMESRSYDFSEYQLGCDNTLLRLGLATRGGDPENPEDYGITYAPYEFKRRKDGSWS